MKNAMQLKSIVKKISEEKKISAQLVLQNYMLERFLERVSLSKYKDNYILKGGLLISSIVGLSSRATMDMDVTVKGYPLSEDSIRRMIEDIVSVKIDDDIDFVVKGVGEIREDDEYGGYRVSLSANYPPISVPLKLDVTTGDKITPKEIEYKYKLMMEDRTIDVLAYNLSTILAEKLETIVARGDQNTRPRDYYDVYILGKIKSEEINYVELKTALNSTIKKRGSEQIIPDYKNILNTVRNSEVMKKQWNNYKKNFDYASEIEFEETCLVAEKLLDKIFKN
ncbi:MAG: nucleotidyl transferase AbiEii/AbiGii toxin family protein [Clostridia bacterium]|nr:nucleotidyl transferase AbiEii/AbiGii toxin family protein [Clostridia bacterium]